MKHHHRGFTGNYKVHHQVFNMSAFNHNFAREKEEYLIDFVRKNRGCFNPNCRKDFTAATKRCR